MRCLRKDFKIKVKRDKKFKILINRYKHKILTIKIKMVSNTKLYDDIIISLELAMDIG